MVLALTSKVWGLRFGFDYITALYRSTVHSKLDYCNSLSHNLPNCQLNWLQQIQNSRARAVVKAPKSTHITPILESLHLLKVNVRIEYKLPSLTYKVLTPVNLALFTAWTPFNPVTVPTPHLLLYPFSLINHLLIENHRSLILIITTVSINPSFTRGSKPTFLTNANNSHLNFSSLVIGLSSWQSINQSIKASNIIFLELPK